MLARAGLTLLAGFALVYSLAYVDVTLRAKEAYLQGEKYLAWSREPALKKAALEAEYAGRENKLRRDRAAGRMTEAELSQRVALLRFDLQERVSESALKYAYVWFKSGAELFSPPESKWARLSRDKMAVAKELWKKELDAQKVPYAEHMLE
jgi:hypothetical protein